MRWSENQATCIPSRNSRFSVHARSLCSSRLVYFLTALQALLARCSPEETTVGWFLSWRCCDSGELKIAGNKRALTFVDGCSPNSSSQMVCLTFAPSPAARWLPGAGTGNVCGSDHPEIETGGVLGMLNNTYKNCFLTKHYWWWFSF